MKIKKLNALKSFIQSLTDGTDLLVNVDGLYVTLTGRNGYRTEASYATGGGLDKGVRALFAKPGDSVALQVVGWPRSDDFGARGGWESIPADWLKNIARADEHRLMPPGFDSITTGIQVVRIERADQIMIPCWDAEGCGQLAYEVNEGHDWATNAEEFGQTLEAGSFWAKRWPFHCIHLEPMPGCGYELHQTAVFFDYWGNRTLVPLTRAVYDALTAKASVTADVAG